MSDQLELRDRLGTIAAQDGRSVREAMKDAVFLYLSLPPGARRALHALNVIGDETDLTAIAEAATPAIVRAGFRAARRTGAEAAARTYPNSSFATEADVETEAVRLTRAVRAVAG